MAKILITEDEDALRSFVARALRLDGHETYEAADGEQGLEKLQETSFDLLLSDIRMPVMDGIAATRAIRALERTHHRRRTPVVMVTANTTEAHHRLAAEAGCDGLVVKPVTLQTLLDGLSYGMAQSEAAMAEAV